MEQFGIKDALDIILVATLLFYLYRMMKESGSLSIFLGILAFIVVWVVVSEILEMRLMGTIMDKFMNIGLLIFVILFQEPIKRFLIDIGSHHRWRFMKTLFNRKNGDSHENACIMPIVYACMSMSKSKTGALIVIQHDISLEKYQNLGDMIDAKVNARLLENIFFKNSPLHDGAVIIANNRIAAAGCILPVSHDTNVPKQLGLRHRSALGVSQASDAMAVVVSEETGNISVAYKGHLSLHLSVTELEHKLAKAE